MRLLMILIFFVFLTNCAKLEMNSTRSLAKPAPIAVMTPTEELRPPLITVVPNLKLNAKQQKYLDESLSPKLREILEKAESFEIPAEVRKEGEEDGEWATFEPNRVLKVIDQKDKREVLESYYFDASNEDSPAVCYYPPHFVRAVYQGKTVEVEICFSCSRFIVKSEFGEFQGTIVRENRKSDDFLTKLLRENA